MKRFSKSLSMIFACGFISIACIATVVSCTSQTTKADDNSTQPASDSNSEIKSVNFQNTTPVNFVFDTKLNSDDVNNVTYELFCNNEKINNDDYTISHNINNEEIEYNVELSGTYLSALSINKYDLTLKLSLNNTNFVFNQIFQIAPTAKLTNNYNNQTISVVISDINPSDATIQFTWYSNSTQSKTGSQIVASSNIKTTSDTSSIISANDDLYYYCIVTITSNHITTSLTSSYMKASGDGNITINNNNNH